jgi:hypothetical protein
VDTISAVPLLLLGIAGAVITLVRKNRYRK